MEPSLHSRRHSLLDPFPLDGSRKTHHSLPAFTQLAPFIPRSIQAHLGIDSQDSPFRDVHDGQSHVLLAVSYA